MSAALHLAKPTDLPRIVPLVVAFHEEQGIALSDSAREAALSPLLDGSPHGAIYLIGPARAPIGYVIITFGWSVEFGGMEGFIDELYVRPGVRKRGIATEVLHSLPRALAGVGMRALHLEVDRTDEASLRLYAKSGFQPRERYMLMTRSFP